MADSSPALEPLDASRTAVVLVDLMKGVTGTGGTPHHPDDVVRNAVRLAKELRARGGLVVPVRVDHGPDGSLAPAPPADVVPQTPPELPADWNDLVPELAEHADMTVTKSGWDPFHGTGLDLLLRRRGVRTLLLGGMATHLGVESAARSAHDLGYAQVFVEDAMTDFAAPAHTATTTELLPMLGKVRSTEQTLAALA